MHPPKFLLAQKFWREAILRTYGRLFAEFLEDHSLVGLRLLASPTCVGLRYGSLNDNLRSFSRKALLRSSLGKTQLARDARTLPLKAVFGICRENSSRAPDGNPIIRSALSPSSLHQSPREGTNINVLSIACGFRHWLRTASPLADCHCQGNLGFTASRFLTGFAGYSCQHSHFLSLHGASRLPLQCKRNALLPCQCKALASPASVLHLAPLHFRRDDPMIVSCYTLFKGWLPLSQPPICLSIITTFHT